MSSGSDDRAAKEPAEKPGRPKPPPLPAELLKPALEAIDLAFSDEDLALMGVQAAVHRRGYGLVREAPLADNAPPALRFEPRIPGVVGRPARMRPGRLRLPRARRPADLESLAFASIPELASLVRSGRSRASSSRPSRWTGCAVSMPRFCVS